MPFANLPTHEKDAFFALLDEYFTSRPDLLSRVGGAGVGHDRTRMDMVPPSASTIAGAGAAGTAITAAAQRAVMANPAAASRMLATGINRVNNSGSAAAASSNNGHAPPAVNVGRVAAAAHAFSAVAPPSTKAAGPPVAPQRGADVNKLAPQKKFGDVDVSSAGAMFRSLRGSTAAKNAPPPTVYTPPAFAGKKASASFAPPPVRRVSASAPASVASAPEPEEDAQPEWAEEEEAGEWAEALYEYTSEEASDLSLQAGERVRVTEKTSSDWWTGEVDGRNGLFPASYVKLL